MKHELVKLTLVTLLVLSGRGATGAGHRLAVTLEPQFGGSPLTFDAVTNTTAAGQVVSVTRLDFLLSNIALRSADGAWLGLTDWFAYLSPREGRTSFELNNLPAGRYDRLRFQVGVPPEVNHRDPSQYPPAHPLHPDVNGLHWGWMGGYVFLAIEGHWMSRVAATRESAANLPGESGFSFHLATDRQLMTVELPLALDLSADRELQLVLRVDEILTRPNAITITEATASTHSRTNDTLADQLRENVERAFTVARISSPTPVTLKGGETNKVEIAADATPYLLTISASFPRPALPLDNPLTEEGVELGRRLFFDPRLSVNNAQSCASCHTPSAAFSERKATSVGAEGQAGTRNAMALFNLAWKSSFFWDGRAPTLREQVLLPIQNPIEMHETLTNVVAKLQSSRSSQREEARTLSAEREKGRKGEKGNSLSDASSPFPLFPSAPLPADFPALFTRAFGTAEITSDRIARALEQFLLTQVSHDAKFDRVMRGQETLTEQEKRGFELFHTEYDPRRRQFGADCFHCHGGPLFQSQTFANNGLDAKPSDLGRFLVTGRAGDTGKFAVPSLRNVALTGPYMHDGRFASLEEVLEHYTGGVKRSATLDPNLAKHPGGGVPLNDSDKQALVAFLKTLTDERFAANAASR